MRWSRFLLVMLVALLIWAVVVIAALGCLKAHAAWLPALSGTFPTQDDADTTCTNPQPAPRAGVMLTGYFRWSGPVTWTDEVASSYGATFYFPRRWVPPGTYILTATCADSAGNVSCPAILSRRTREKPARIEVTP